MDLSQTKLNKAEWLSIEVSVSDAEKRVLQLIIDGYNNPNNSVQNDAQSILSHMKIAQSDEMDAYVFSTYFEPYLKTLLDPEHTIKNWLKTVANDKKKAKKPNKSDMIRIDNMSASIELVKHNIFEFVMLTHIAGLAAPASSQHSAAYHAYTLVQFKKCKVAHINPYIVSLADHVLEKYRPDSPESVREAFLNAHDIIEKNPDLIRYENRDLYDHQKQLFSVFSTKKKCDMPPTLVLYVAPTGTGKTMSPIGLSEGHRIIFVCVARHVGLALAKSAISMGKRVAFAFGCETASDIRLHYFAAVDYKVNKRSGGIGKVDNSMGQKVEIMICDVASYLVAMRYMLSFHSEQSLITYWDEPTITMDYDTHELHDKIHENWALNRISKVVLSCATLPKQWEIQATVADFKDKFRIEATLENELEEDIEPVVLTIDSYDCKKNIAMLDNKGYPVLPHLLFSKYRDVLECVEHCNQNKSLLRYFDLAEIVRFIQYVNNGKYPVDSQMQVEQYFPHISDITMKSIKQYYLRFLASLDDEYWPLIHAHMTSTNEPKLGLTKEQVGGIRKIQSLDNAKVSGGSGGGGGELRRIASVAIEQHKPTAAPTRQTTAGVMITTTDAHTLTDGPTIFLAEDVEKIGLFYLQQANIPEKTFVSILEKIERNNVVQRKIGVLEKQLDDKEAAITGDSEKTKKLEREGGGSRETARLMEQIDALRRDIQSVSLPARFIPNTLPHQDTYIPAGFVRPKGAFAPSIDETDVREIMALNVSNQRKLLLILGIGVFARVTGFGPQDPAEVRYMEVMKSLAQDKRLFLIIASSDYIYGTNYQFSHGFIGKDLENMTQQKTIQAIGRVGRTNVQHDYTIRFRDNDVLAKLFLPAERNLEAEVMSRLFVSA
mgnify:CR=1 FL=1